MVDIMVCGDVDPLEDTILTLNQENDVKIEDSRDTLDITIMPEVLRPITIGRNFFAFALTKSKNYIGHNLQLTK